jgi:hypothetical protein
MMTGDARRGHRTPTWRAASRRRYLDDKGGIGNHVDVLAGA